jgi:hypothetical protein
MGDYLGGDHIRKANVNGKIVDYDGIHPDFTYIGKGDGVK